MLPRSGVVRRQTVRVLLVDGQVVGSLNATTVTDITDASVRRVSVSMLRSHVWRVCAWKRSRLWSWRRLQNACIGLPQTADMTCPNLVHYSKPASTYFCGSEIMMVMTMITLLMLLSLSRCKITSETLNSEVKNTSVEIMSPIAATELTAMHRLWWWWWCWW